MCGGLCADLNRENNDKTSSGKKYRCKVAWSLCITAANFERKNQQ